MTSRPPPADDPGPRLIARILHDIAGPISGLTTAVDLLSDETQSALRPEAITLARDSLARLAEKIAFFRAVFAESTNPTGDTFGELASALFAGSRIELNATPLPPDAPAEMARVLLILLQILGEALPSGGGIAFTADVTTQSCIGALVGSGPRLRLREESRLGLAAAPAPATLTARWAPAALARLLADRAKAQLIVEENQESLGFRLVWPHASAEITV